MKNLCCIAMKSRDGIVESIRYYDYGNFDNTAITLYKFFQDPNKIKSLLKLGDISYLGANVNPDPTMYHDFLNRQSNVTVALKRDSGEEDCEMQVFKNLLEYRKMINLNDIKTYFYYDLSFDCWFFSDYDEIKKKYNFEILEDYIKNEHLVQETPKELDNIIRKSIEFDKMYDGEGFQEAYESDEDAYYDIERLFSSKSSAKMQIDMMVNYQKEMATRTRLDDENVAKMYQAADQLVRLYNKYLFDNFMDMDKEKRNEGPEM